MDKVEKAFDDFFLHDKQKVLFLKGPWGSGKSFFVRQYLSKPRAFVPSCQYFTSLFGLGTLEQVREAINASLNYRPSLGGKRWFSGAKFGEAADSLQKLPKLYGFSVGAIGTSLFWFIARHQNSVIVFDDMERAKISPHEILGLASSLAENSKAKIIVIFNEDKLVGDNQATLIEYREKVVDVELLFKPSDKELANKFLRREPIREEIAILLDEIKATNIRLINRINEHLDQFVKVVGEFGIEPTADELVHVAKIVCLHYVGKQKLTPEMVASGLFGLFIDNKGQTDDEREFAELVKSINIFPALPFDGLALELVQNGYCPDETKKKYLDGYKDNKARNDLNNAIQKAYDRYLNNFLGTIEEVFADMEEFLDGHSDKVNTDQFRANIGFLNELQYSKDVEKWKALHLGVIAQYPRAEDRIAAAKTLLPSEIVESYIEKVSAESKKPAQPLAIISKVITSSSWHPDDCAALNAMTDEEVFQWMSTDSSERFIRRLREIIKMWSGHSEDAQSFIRKVQGAAGRILEPETGATRRGIAAAPSLRRPRAKGGLFSPRTGKRTKGLESKLK
jgi:hypothetical protein